MNFAPTEEQNMVIEAARTFVRRELLPHEDIVEELNRVPDDLFEQIKKRSIEKGLFAANIPTEFGGGGLDTLTFTLLERELGWVSYALHYVVHRPSNILQAGTRTRSMRN